MRNLVIAVVCAVLAMMAVVGIKEGRRADLPELQPTQTVDQDIATISTGEKVDIEEHVPQTGLTVIAFTADFEMACKTVRPQLESIAKEREDVRLRIVDIEAYSSEVAQQHSIRRLPTLWLYEDGTLVTKDTNEVVSRLRQKK